MNGQIFSLIPERRYGFIRADSDNDQNRYFFHKDDYAGHWDDLAAAYKSGKPIKVNFEIVKSDKGPRAAFVMMIVE